MTEINRLGGGLVGAVVGKVIVDNRRTF